MVQMSCCCCNTAKLALSGRGGRGERGKVEVQGGGNIGQGKQRLLHLIMIQVLGFVETGEVVDAWERQTV